MSEARFGSIQSQGQGWLAMCPGMRFYFVSPSTRNASNQRDQSRMEKCALPNRSARRVSAVRRRRLNRRGCGQNPDLMRVISRISDELVSSPQKTESASIRKLAFERRRCPYNPGSASKPRNDRDQTRMPRCAMTERLPRLFPFHDAGALNALRERRRRRRSQSSAARKPLGGKASAGWGEVDLALISRRNDACYRKGTGAPASKAMVPMFERVQVDRLDRSWTGSKSNRSTDFSKPANGIARYWTGWTGLFQSIHMRARARARAHGHWTENSGPTGPKPMKSAVKPVHLGPKSSIRVM